MMDIREQKKTIRKTVRELKKTTPKERQEMASLAIQEKILAMEEIRSAATILLYYALPDEVDTRVLLRRLSNREEGNKKVILPVVEGEFLILKEYIPSDVKEGYREILEPQGEECINPAEIEIAVIPGVAFDSSCNRMGRGKGFYDKLLPHLKCRTIGLGYGFQIVEKIPCEPFDKPLDCVVTEDAIYNIKE